MHKSVTVLAATAALAVTLTGCANVGAPGAAAPVASASPAVDPKVALASAFGAMKEGTFAYTMAFDQSVEAHMIVDNDVPGTHAVVTISEDGASMSIESYQTGDAVYMKMDMTELLGELAQGRELPEGLDGKKWLRLDPARSKQLAGSIDQVALDPAHVERSIKTIDRKTAHTYTGTIDMTTLTPTRFGKLATTPEEKAAREAAGNVPFRAETDGEGRIVFFAADVKAEGVTVAMTMHFSEWGTAQLPPVPAPGSYVEAPDSFYDMGRGI